MTNCSWMIGALGSLGLLACAPAHAIGSAPTCAPVTGPSTASAPSSGTASASSAASDAARPIPVRGETVVDVGGGRSLELHTDGSIDSSGHELRAADDSQRLRAYQSIVTPGNILLAVGEGNGADSQRTDLVDLFSIDPHTGDRRWRSIVAPLYQEGERVIQWRVLATRDRVLLVEDHRVIAIDARTGTQLWTVWLYTPQFAATYLSSTISPEIETLHIDDARIRGRELVLDVRLGDASKPTTFELDVDSGRRVYVEAPRDPPPELALSGFGRVVVQAHVAVRDDPPPPPPPQPLRVTGYDGLAIGTTLLLWDTAGRGGVIVNPTHDTLGEVLARARALRIVDASGKSVPIRWSAVLDTGAIADAVARDRKQPPLVGKDGAVQFDYGLVNMDALDVVDAASLGRELGVPAVTSHVGRPKGIGLRLVREPDEYTTIRVSWGPFELDDTNRPENSGFVTPL